MLDYQYTNVTGKLVSFMAKIREVGVPPKVTNTWLESIGYKSKNDRSLLPVLEFLGFIDTTHLPTQVWTDYRGKNHKEVLGSAMKIAYQELFQMYPDAFARDNEDLIHFFSTKNKSGSQVITRIVNTFKALAGLATFSEDMHVDPAESFSIPTTQEDARAVPAHSVIHRMPSPSIHVDLQIHISPEASPDQIEKVFECMSRYIFNKKYE